MSHMDDHHPHFGTAYFVSQNNIGQGDVVAFMYKGKQRTAFVLHENYEGKMHALDMSLTPRQVLIDQVVDVMYQTPIPYEVYHREVYKVAKGFDSYRTYFVKEISQLRRIGYYLTKKKKFKNGEQVE
jgi:hypothetical protein